MVLLAMRSIVQNAAKAAPHHEGLIATCSTSS